MPDCKSCGVRFSNRIWVSGKLHNIQNRKYCLDCSPFKSHNTKQIHLDQKTDDEKRKSAIKAVTKRRRKLMEMAIEYKGGKCSVCGYNRCNRALEFHHVNRADKDFSISSQGYTRGWEKMKVELDKCVLLCANCHREVEAGLINVKL